MKRDKPRQSIKLLRNKVVNVIALLLVWLNVFSQSQKPRVHIGFVYPISNHGTFAKEYTNSFSFHLLGGVSRSETAFTLSGFTNVIVDSATGVQIAGFSNHIKNVATGVQIAGFVNTYGIGNGLQLAGFTNIACDNVKGLQLSGFLNKAGQTRGLQLTGFTNVAANVTGAQVSGFVNVARKVRGVQISGFINIADSSDYPIGLINLVKNGEKTIAISVDETQTTLLSFRSGGRVLYGIVGAGYNFKNKKAVYAIEAGLGAHIPITKDFHVNVEGVAITLNDFRKDSYLRSSLRLLPALRIYKGIELFGGPTLNYVFTNTTEGKALTQHHIWEKTQGDNLHALYFGAVGGIQFKL